METWDRARRSLRLGSRRAVKQLTAAALERSRARHVLAEVQRRRAGGQRVQIFAWHRIVSDFERRRRLVIPGLLTSTSTFDKQIAWLKRTYRLGTLDDALDVLSGRANFEEDLCVLTFDDGYADFVEHALPILERHEAPSTIYVASATLEGEAPLLHDRLYLLLRAAKRRKLNPDKVEAEEPALGALRHALAGDEIVGLEWLLETKPRAICLQVAEALERRLGEEANAAWEESKILTWERLIEARDRGVTIGAHTVDHACLPNETGPEVDRQLKESKAALESRLQQEVCHFAYPNGWYAPSVLRAVARAGYRSAVTTEDRPNRYGEDPLVLKRRSVWEYTSRGVVGFSRSVNACNFDGTMGALGIAPWVPGEKPDGVRGLGPQEAPPAGGVEQLRSGA